MGFVILQAWKATQTNILESLKGQDLCLLGDGRCNSHSHLAKYLAYSFVDAEISEVVHAVQVQVREVRMSFVFAL